MLSARDKDSAEDEILYEIKMPALLGEIRKVYYPLSPGIPISQFTQQDVNLGYIYYFHFGKSKTKAGHKKDSFEFILRDQSSPPNRSGKNIVTVKILSNNSKKPAWVNNSKKTADN